MLIFCFHRQVTSFLGLNPSSSTQASARMSHGFQPQLQAKCTLGGTIFVRYCTPGGYYLLCLIWLYMLALSLALQHGNEGPWAAGDLVSHRGSHTSTWDVFQDAFVHECKSLETLSQHGSNVLRPCNTLILNTYSDAKKCADWGDRSHGNLRKNSEKFLQDWWITAKTESSTVQRKAHNSQSQSTLRRKKYRCQMKLYQLHPSRRLHLTFVTMMCRWELATTSTTQDQE